MRAWQLLQTAHRPLRRRQGLWLFAWGLAMLALAGCTPFASLPKVDLSSPGWKVWNGQARWQPDADRSALAGELIAAQHSGGDVLVVFSKPPFPIFTAQTSGKLWKIDFVERARSYSGLGRPPERFVWFRVPDVLEGGSAPEDWRVESNADGQWSITNDGTGEAIWLVIDP